MLLSNALLITASLAGGILLSNVVSGAELLELRPAHGVVISSLSLVSNQLYGAGRCVCVGGGVTRVCVQNHVIVPSISYYPLCSSGRCVCVCVCVCFVYRVSV